MAKKSVKKRKKIRILFTVLCLVINALIIYSIVSTFNNVYQKSKEKKQLTEELSNLKEKGEALRVEANRLQDPDYVARYAREKYLYSGKNEFVIRMP